MLKTLNHPGVQCNHKCWYTFLFSSIAWKVFFFCLIISTGFASAQLPAFYVGTNGDDNASGTTAESAWRTIQHALNTVGEGSTVYILPGTYPEALRIKKSGIRLVSANGPGTVFLHGSLPASGMTWTRLTAGTTPIPDNVEENVWWTQLNNWDYEPRALYQIVADGIRRLPRARAPNWCGKDDWMASQNGWHAASETYKYKEKWWRPDSTMTTLGKAPGHDNSYLIDKVDDPWTSPGNLQSFFNLAGALAHIVDNGQGYSTPIEKISMHDRGAGRIGWGHNVSIWNNATFGKYSRYYLAAHPELLDLPGEWWYDSTSKRLYLYPVEGVNPATLNIEVPRFSTVIDLKGQDNTLLDGLVVRFANVDRMLGGSVYYAITHYGPSGSTGSTIRNCTVEHCGGGIKYTLNAPATKPIQNLTIENCIFRYHDYSGVQIINNNDNAMLIDNVSIQNSEFCWNGFMMSAPQNNVGVRLAYIGNFIFAGNHVHHNAHNGTMVSNTGKGGFIDASVSIYNNIFEWNCLAQPDNGGLNLESCHYRECRVYNNISRHHYGFSWQAYDRAQEGNPLGGFVPGGYKAHGIYLDSGNKGVEVFDNRVTDAKKAGINDLKNVGFNTYYGNIIESCDVGIRIATIDIAGNAANAPTNIKIHNNQFINISNVAIEVCDTVGFSADYDRFQDCTNLLMIDNLVYKTLNNVRQNTPYEQHGAIGPPLSTRISKLDVIQVLNNPYQGVGEIEFTNLPAEARMSIYSIRGDFIKNLSAHSSNGVYTWNGRNEKGCAVNPGIYIAMISERNDHRAIKIMVLSI